MLTLELLQALTPYQHGCDLVTEASRDLLINCLKLEPSVREVFFENVDADRNSQFVDKDGFPFENLATLFAAEALTKVKDGYLFHAMIDRKLLERKLRNIYDGIPWKKLGFQLYTLVYPEVVKDKRTGTCMADYIDGDGSAWADQLIADISDPRWMKGVLYKFVTGQYSDEDYNKDMNVLFVKLHLLDPQSVIPAYQHLLSLKALPAVNLELATRNYLGGPLIWTCIKDDVEAALNKQSIPNNASRLSLDDIQIYYGVRVDEFVITQCRDLSVWTGKRPDNCRRSRFKDRCDVM